MPGGEDGDRKSDWGEKLKAGLVKFMESPPGVVRRGSKI